MNLIFACDICLCMTMKMSPSPPTAYSVAVGVSWGEWLLFLFCPVYLTCENEEDIACIFCSSCFLHPHLGFSSLPHLSGRRLTQLSLISLVSHNSWLSVSLSVLWMRTLMWLDYPLLLVFLCTVGTFAPSPPARHRRKPGFNAVAAFFSGLA